MNKPWLLFERTNVRNCSSQSRMVVFLPLAAMLKKLPVFPCIDNTSAGELPDLFLLVTLSLSSCRSEKSPSEVAAAILRISEKQIISDVLAQIHVQLETPQKKEAQTEAPTEASMRRQSKRRRGNSSLDVD